MQARKQERPVADQKWYTKNTSKADRWNSLAASIRQPHRENVTGKRKEAKKEIKEPTNCSYVAANTLSQTRIVPPKSHKNYSPNRIESNRTQ